MLYQIILKGHMMKDYFEPMICELLEDGTTSLTGEFQDQAQLFGILTRIRNLNIELISIQQLMNTN